jgi:hypothetical protein
MAFALFVGPESTQGWQLGQLQVSRPMLASIVSIIDGVLILVVLIASLRREARAADLFDNAEFTSLCGEGAFNAGELVKRYRPLTMRTEN